MFAMHSARFRPLLFPRTAIFRQSVCRNLSIIRLPKNGGESCQSQPFAIYQNRKGDVVHDFVNNSRDEDVEILTFAEEPLGMPAKLGFGYLQVGIGERFGPDSRFEILRKLGWGQCSSIWLAKDTIENRFVAIKALSGHATYQCKKRLRVEHYILNDLSRGKSTSETHCLTQIAGFIQPGKEEADGEHLCFVTDPLGPSLFEFRKQGWRYTKPLIKKFLRHTLLGLSHMHSLGVAHTDLKPENILMDLGTGSEMFDIESFIRLEPAKSYPQQRTQGGKFMQAAMSQPFPIPPFKDWMSRNFIITDFGNAQYVDHKVYYEIMPQDLRAPEVILGLPWNEKVDIWAFGCLVFEFINSQRLLKSNTTEGLETVDPNVLSLWQIISLTKERVPPEVIRSSERAMRYLNPETGMLNDGRPLIDIRFLDILKQIGALTKPEDLVGCNSLLKKCLRLDSLDRPSARELLGDPWLNAET